MALMFNECNNLKEIKGINLFSTKKVLSMERMFNFCTSLEYLDLSKFKTSHVINMRYMFYECNKLRYLNLLNFHLNGQQEKMLSFHQKGKCKFVTYNKHLVKLFYSFK